MLIAHLGATDALHDRAVELLVDAADEQLGASPLTLAEVYVGPGRTGKLVRAQKAIRDLDVTVVPLGEGAPERLATLRSSTGLRLPGCWVLHAAELSAADVATFDDRLRSAAVGLGLTVRG